MNRSKSILALLVALLLVLGAAPALADGPVPLLWVPTVLNGSTIYPQSDCFVAQKINEQFGVQITVQETNSQAAEEMALMYASGIIPDVNPVFPGNFFSFYEQGMYRDIPLEMIQQYMPTYYAYSKELIDYDSMPVNIDGKIYGLPHTTNPPPNQSVIRTDWLQKLGLSMPRTLADFEEVARAFAQDDPDGNGQNDTYMLAWGPGWGMNFQWISAAYDLETDYLLVDGKLQDKRVTENYKEYLKYLQGLYQKGYIYPDLTLPKKDNVSELLTTGTIGYFADTFTWLMPLYRPSAYYARLFDQNPQATTDYVPPLERVDGGTSTFLEGTPAWMYTCIGRNTTDEQLIKILEILEAQCADNTFHNLIWRGVEGEHFTYNEDGMAVYTDAYNVLDNQQKAGLKSFFINIRIGEQMIYSYGKEITRQEAFIKEYFAPLERFKIPQNSYNAASLEYGADIKAIADEFFMKALAGNVDVDAEWNAYVTSMERAGLTEIMDEYNVLYETLSKD